MVNLQAAKQLRMCHVRPGPLKGPHGPVAAEGESGDSQGDWLQVATSANGVMKLMKLPRGAERPWKLCSKLCCHQSLRLSQSLTESKSA